LPSETSSALLNDPMAIAAWLAAIPAVVFWLSGMPRFRKLFDITPPILYVYFLPTVATTLGITPPASATYDWLIRYALPLALVLLMITVDLPALARLGKTALFMMLVGTVGIVLGGPLALLVFKHWLPADAWMGFAALSGSWIGGATNMVAMAASVGTPSDALGPVIVVDAVVGYGWMGIVLFLSAYQARFDRSIRARTETMEEANRHLSEVDSLRRPLEIRDAVILLGLGLVGAVLSVQVGDLLPELGNPTIISHTTWAVILVVTVGLLVSFTPARGFETAGASRLGSAFLYILLAGLGSQANLRSVVEAPVYLAAGALWIAVQVVLLLIAARLIRAPLFFFATGSMANVGGVVSAPIVAGVYQSAMAPVGLLMAVLGNILGIYAALVCAWLLSLVGG
jgi:uncharacterized membrane protein